MPHTFRHDRRHNLHVSVLAAFMAGMATLATAADMPLATPVEGAPFPAELTAISPAGQLTFATGQETRTLSLSELVTWGQCPEQGRGLVLVLADGSLLAADVLAANQEELTFDSLLFGVRKIALEAVRGVVLRLPLDRRGQDALFDRISHAAGENDRLLLDNGDELTGLLLGMQGDAVTIDAAVGKVDVALARTAAVIFNPALVRRAAHADHATRVWIGFRDGTRLLATAIATDDRKLRVTAAGQTWSASRAELVFLQPLDGRARYLSAFRPAAYRQTPYLKMPWPYQSDRDVAGGWLRCGGELYLKGLGVHSAAKLTFALDQLQPTPADKFPLALVEGQRNQGSGAGDQRPGVRNQGPGARDQGSEIRGPSRFCAEAAITASAAGQGSVQFRVLVDGRERFVSPILRGGDAPLPVSVDVQNARTLELVVDYADRADVLDRAAWLNARLVVPPATPAKNK